MDHVSNGFATGLRRRWRLYVALAVCFLGFALAKPATLLAIDGYQQFISPHKGYRCAYGVLYGTSCSQFGEQAIRDYGLIGGLILLRQQFHDCSDAAAQIRSGACQVNGARAEDANECFESEHDRGKRDAQETQEYCAGCVEGCCGE
jgi:putative component of membrane protein insertase Oxa1/YidC/SpoIIIJ protein YidD